MRVVSPSYSGPALGGPGVCIQGTSAMGKLTPFMVAFWPLTEASGNRVDLIGGYTLTDVGTVGSSSDGLFGGNRARLTRADGDYLGLDGGGSLIPSTGSFSIALWVEFVTLPVDGQAHFLLAVGNGAAGSLYIAGIAANPPGLQARIKEAGGSRTLTVDGSALVVTGERVLVALAYDVSVPEMRLFVYCPELGTYSKSMAVDGTGNTPAATTYLRLGSFNGAAGQGADAYQEQFAIFSGYALTATDVTALYNSASGLTFAQIQALT